MIRRILWAVLMSYVAVMVAAALCIWYANYVNQQSDQKWCELLVTLDNPIPPDSDNPRSVDAAVKFHRLRVNLGC